MADAVIFSGFAVCAADSKGRFALPLDLRKDMRIASGGESRMCVTMNRDATHALCYGRSHKEWLEQQIGAREAAAIANGGDYDGDRDRVDLFAEVDELNFDEGGRFFLPADIKEILGLGDVIVFVAASRTIQMWDPQAALKEYADRPRLRHAIQQFLNGGKAK